MASDKERCTTCDRSSGLSAFSFSFSFPFPLSAQSSAHDHQAPAGRPGAAQGAHARYDDLKWQIMVPELGADGPQAAILRVDPKTQATQLLIRMPKRMHVPVHWHSANETHTVIKGTMVFEHGGQPHELGPGGFNYIPARTPHQAWSSRRRAGVHHRRRPVGRQLGQRSADQERSRPAAADELTGRAAPRTTRDLTAAGAAVSVALVRGSADTRSLGGERWRDRRAIASAPPGEAQAEESELYRRFAHRVRMYGRKHLRDDSAADDLAQQVLLVTIERLRAGEVRNPDEIGSFILGTSRMLAGSTARKARRRESLTAQFHVPGALRRAGRGDRATSRPSNAACTRSPSAIAGCSCSRSTPRRRHPRSRRSSG